MVLNLLLKFHLALTWLPTDSRWAGKWGGWSVSEGKKFYISSDCPSIVSYVKFYHPALVDNLAPIVSPMVAMSRVVHEKYGKDTKIVFIGPCVAKKAESSEIDEAITFTELRDMLADKGIATETVIPKDFDQPVGGRGAIFPVARGCRCGFHGGGGLAPPVGLPGQRRDHPDSVTMP